MDPTTGARLRALRAECGVSLSELSRRSGVGKGTISELENDRRGARLDTLFALTAALGAPLGAVLSDESGARRQPITGDSVSAVLLDRWTTRGGLVEVYRATLTPDAQRSEAHADGVEETVTVVSGRVAVGSADAQHELGAGESVRYPGDRPHRFQALGEPAEVVLLMHYPHTAIQEGSPHHDH